MNEPFVFEELIVISVKLYQYIFSRYLPTVEQKNL